MDRLAYIRLARAAIELNRVLKAPLPPLVFLTDDERVPEPLAAIRALPKGSLVILRARRDHRRRHLASGISRIAKERRLLWLIANDAPLACSMGADGIHLAEAQVRDAHRWRTLRPHWLITCAAHSRRACARAATCGADAVLLSPVFPTESHADSKAIGPMRIRFIAKRSPLPVYALGGVDETSARRLRDARLAGLAAIGALAQPWDYM
jgi:thiamine-phosphate pyrophosphorylase